MTGDEKQTRKGLRQAAKRVPGGTGRRRDRALKPGDEIPPERNGGMPGYVVGECGHRVAGSEWRAGFRNCERCGS